MQLELKSNNLIPFLAEKNKVELNYRKDSNILRKEAIVNKVESVNEEEGTVWCTITTQNTDRVGDVVMSEGCDTSEFKKIPSVYINHDYSLLPIAKCEEMAHKEGSIMAKIKFALNVPSARNIYELVKGGFMKGISVGFDASEVILRGCKEFDEMCKCLKMDVDTYNKTRRIIKDWILYEFSVVSIPANAECFVKSLTDGKFEVSPDLNKYLGIHKEENPDASELDEEIEVRKWKSFIDHGRAKEKGLKKSEVDGKQLEMGTKVEMEHTNDTEIAERIALDHLAELPDYYSRLEKMEHDDTDTSQESPTETPKDPDPSNGDGVEEHDEFTHSLPTEEITASLTEIEKELAKKEEIVIPPKHITVIEEPKPEIKRHINVLRTPEDTQELINKTVEARLKGKTRLQIKII